MIDVNYGKPNLYTYECLIFVISLIFLHIFALDFHLSATLGRTKYSSCWTDCKDVRIGSQGMRSGDLRVRDNGTSCDVTRV